MMAETAITGALCTYFENCPLLKGCNIDIDFLPLDGKFFSIDAVPGTSILKRYTSGCSIRQHLFILRSASEQNEDTLHRIDNSGLFEQLSDWLETQTRAGILPQLPVGKSAIKIEAQSTAYRYATELSTAGLYQIQCRLIYVQEE
ncbi:MAG: chloramphenicol resistance protein [Ruthenibacterium sp.]